MKESEYKSYDELPLMLNAETLAKALGIAPSSAYELMHQEGFPTLRVGENRLVVPKQAFIIETAMMKQEGVTEALKASDQMEWVRRRNSIRNRAEEVILTELVYA